MPAVPASAIANAPTPPAAPMPAALQSKPEEVSSEDAAVCTMGGGAGCLGGGSILAKAGLVRIAAPRMAAARVPVVRIVLLLVGIAQCDPVRRPSGTPVKARPFAPTSDPFGDCCA